MYSDPSHGEIADHIQDMDEDCLVTALIEEQPLEKCFGNGGVELCYWRSDTDKCCSELLVIDVDYLMDAGYRDRNLIEAIRNMVRDCPVLRHIRIGGSADAMSRHFKLVSPSGGKKKDFAIYIAGINVLKGHVSPYRPPLVVTTMTKFGRGPTSRVKKFRYY